MVRKAMSLILCEIGQKLQENLNKELNSNSGFFQLTQINSFIDWDTVGLPEEVTSSIVKYQDGYNEKRTRAKEGNDIVYFKCNLQTYTSTYPFVSPSGE